MSDIMIDIETAATAANAKILSIGACAFEFNRVKPLESFLDRAFYVNVEPYPPSLPFVEHERTKEWWRNQSEAAKQALEGNKKPIKTALIDFAVWYAELVRSRGGGSVWANPPQFDLMILRNHFEYFKIECPWHWTKERDYRTLRHVAKQKQGFVPDEPPSVIVDGKTVLLEKHNALCDAVMQAHKTQQIMQHLMRGR